MGHFLKKAHLQRKKGFLNLKLGLLRGLDILSQDQMYVVYSYIFNIYNFPGLNRSVLVRNSSSIQFHGVLGFWGPGTSFNKRPDH